MLRSTKLLPLCKGARNWIVAGTVYGPKATTDGSNGDENRREETPDTRYHGKPFHRHARGDRELAGEPPNSFAARDAAFRQNAFRTRADHGQGLASVGRYSSTENHVPVLPGKSNSRFKVVESESVSQSSDKGSSPEVSPRSTTETRTPCDTTTSFDNDASSGPIFGSFGDIDSLEKPGLSDLRKESANFTEANFTGTQTFCEPGLSTFSELQKDVIGTNLYNTSVSPVEAPKTKQETAAVSHQQQQPESANSTTTTTTSSSNKKPHGRHGHYRNRSNTNESHKLVVRVCNILNQHEWGDAVKALDGLNVNLNAYQVNEILKQQKEVGLAYNFFLWARKQAGFKHDVHTYTTMLGILGRAKSFDILNGLLGEMINEGCEPNVVTYNRLIHCYGRANDLESSIKLFNVMQMVGCEPDRVTYCTLIDLQAKAGFHDSAMELYKQMQLAGFKPDTFTYSIIIHCLGKAGKLNAAYKLFCEMTDRGFAPSLVTYNIIIDLHAKAGKFDMALKLYHNLQEVGYMPDRVTYGIIMEVLGNCGHIEDAEHVFEEMVRAGWEADNPIFGLMVDMWGKTGNAEKAAEWFNRMLDSGLQPNVPACNSLLSAYLRACFYDAAAQVLRSMSKWGLLPTLQTYTSLLSSCATCRVQWEYDMVFALMNCTGHPAHPFLCSLLSENMEVLPIRFFFEAMQFEELESRRGFADSLIDFLHKAGKDHAAGNVWEVAAEKNLYPYAVKEKAPNYWSINLHVMSMGTALVVLSKTLASFREAMLRTGAAPYRIDIITGWGRRSRVPGASLVKQAVEDMLRALQSPFYVDGSNVGCFVGQGPALMDWLKAPQLEQVLRFA